MSDLTANMISHKDGRFTRFMGITPGYDKRDENKGRGGAKMWCGIADEHGGASVDWLTPFFIPTARDDLGNLPPGLIGSVSIHLKPEEGVKGRECGMLPGGRCCDGGGSFLAADDAYDALTTGGLDGVWEWLEKFYEQNKT